MRGDKIRERSEAMPEIQRPPFYRYSVGEPDDQGREVRWAYSCKRNRAGDFLTWREVVEPESGEIRRDQFGSESKLNAAAALCQRRAGQRKGD